MFHNWILSSKTYQDVIFDPLMIRLPWDCLVVRLQFALVLVLIHIVKTFFIKGEERRQEMNLFIIFCGYE